MSLPAIARAGDPVDPLALAAVKRERDVDPFTVVARNRKAIRARAQIACGHGDFAIVAALEACASRTFQQQIMELNHAVNTLVIRSALTALTSSPAQDTPRAPMSRSRPARRQFPDRSCVQAWWSRAQRWRADRKSSTYGNDPSAEQSGCARVHARNHREVLDHGTTYLHRKYAQYQGETVVHEGVAVGTQI